MKKVLTLLIAVLLVTITGCGSQGDAGSIFDNGDKSKGMAEIESILIDNAEYTQFDKNQLEYSYVVPENSSEIPYVMANITAGKGEVKIVQSDSMDGKATVSLNGVTYTISFKKRNSMSMLNNTYYKLNTEKALKVAYFGGSVTY